MRTNHTPGILIVVGLLLSACASGQTQIVTVEATRIVRETQIVTAEVTRIVRKRQVVSVEATRLVRETQIITAEVTRIVREPAITPTPLEISLDVTRGASLPVPRSMHTATRLADGRILLVGGSQAPDEQLARVEIFDPATGSFGRAASLHSPRHDHSATLLLDGRVLVVGGYSHSRQWLDDAEVYDPWADTWTVVPTLYMHGVQHTATLMRDGRVLVVGGCIGDGVCTGYADIFDPQTNSWTEAMPQQAWRASHSALLLEDGRVLVAGGAGPGNSSPAGGDAQLYDPRANTWMATGPMVKPRIFAQAVRLLDGRVLVAGGRNLDDAQGRMSLSSAEIFDPATNTWSAAAELSQARYAFVLVLLPDGQALAIGGARDQDNAWNVNSFVREIESYDPVADRWRISGELPEPGVYSTVSLLVDGRMWVAGGHAGYSRETYWSDTWLIALR